MFLRKLYWTSRFGCLLLLSATLLGRAGTTDAAGPAELQFSRDVLPILSANCFPCHGPDEAARQADLRFDERDAAVDAGAIVEGSPEESPLWQRITSADPDEVMPPPATKKSLTSAQKDVLRRWIEAGAPYQAHWSFVPPEKRSPPDSPIEAWNRNPIDRFVAARLRDERLDPSPEARATTLLRRVTLDLTGLPPTAKDVDEFASDAVPGAYERLVDRLLASPHYGERMALDWLDAARYADSNGYSIDGGRQMWLWRDWVINAFNSNLPYDEFLVEQLAGDLLPNRTDAQLTATGFQRNNMVTHEGGTIPEENLTNYNADRVKTYGETMLGLTLGCAQCHDHKYDPITQRDYYRLFAYFNSLSDAGLDGDGGRNPMPIAELESVLRPADLAELPARIESIEREMRAPMPDQFAAWEAREQVKLKRRGQEFALHRVKLLKVSTPNSGAGFEIVDNRVQIKSPAGLVAYDVLAELPRLPQPITGFRILFHRSAAALEKGLGYGTLPAGTDVAVAADAKTPAKPGGTFVLTAVSISADAVAGDQVNLNRLRPIAAVTASSWRPEFRPENVLDTRNINGWSPESSDATPVVTLSLNEPLAAADEPFATVQTNFGYGGSLVAADFEIFAMTGVDDGSDLPAGVIAALSVDPAVRSAPQAALLRSYFIDHSPETAALRAKLANAQERLAALTSPSPTMVMDLAARPRETHLLHRGDYAQPGERVEPGTPTALPPLPAGAPANRLGLAQWTVMDANPLTARVAVNRIWRLFFGVGLVATPADFGAQGQWPSHPELLDWLAIDFRKHGWDVKRLVRMIVTSQTYRQDSTTSAESLAADAENRLLARGARFRLPAELVRDAALKTSGLLVDWVGGPSVNPYTPGDLWREVSHYGSTPATAQTFVQDHGEKLYRRSLYTYWKRTAPPPNMMAFDAPNREICTVSRSATTTPMQALVLLNDVQFVEAARALAERTINASGDDAQRIDWAFRECLSRSPRAGEAAVVQRMVDRERLRYADDQTAAAKLLSAGESPRDATIAVAEHAAWTQAATLMLNLSETITRE